MKKLFQYMRGFGKECVLGPLFKLLEASFELLVPLVVASIVDVGIGNGDGRYILTMCLVMVGLGVVGLICAVVAQFFAAKAAVGFAARLRHQLMKHVLDLSYSQLDRLGGATMVTRMTSDVNQVQNGVNLTLRLLLRSPFVVFGAMVMAFTIDVRSALVFAGLIPVLCLVVFGIMLVTMPMYKRVQALLDRVTGATRQTLSGVRVIRAFRREEQEVADFESSTERLQSRQRTAGRISGLMNPVTFVIVNLAVVILIRQGAIQVQGGILTQGLVIALYNYMTQILVELIKMANLIITMTKAVACGNRIGDVLAIVPDAHDGQVQEKILGNVEFQDVSVTYAGSPEPALEHISFSAKAGQTVGIIGGTGSGKTTLIHALAGFYPVSGGTIQLDGRPLDMYHSENLRRAVGIVPQKAVLFQGTIRENLLWGNAEATENDLWWALEIAQAREVVKSKEGELDAPVTQNGGNFSGGQRQRLTVARALVQRPAILIMDDSASALDYATDGNLRKAIAAVEPKPTTFIVSQRAASVRFADQILVLDDGKAVGIGTHEMLLETCPVYQEIYYSQFPKEVAGHA